MKPGTRVYYISSVHKNKVYGTVVSNEEALQRVPSYMVSEDRVFCFWEKPNGEDFGFMYIKDVHLVDELNLPEWF